MDTPPTNPARRNPDAENGVHAAINGNGNTGSAANAADPTTQRRPAESTLPDLALAHAARLEILRGFSGGEVPPSVDSAVLAAAAGQAASIRRRRFVVRAVSLAAAAAIALGVGTWTWLSLPTGGSASPTNSANQALAHARAPRDIVDVLTLARHLEQGATLDASLDLDADGRVTRADLDSFARRLVQLGPAGPTDLVPVVGGGPS